MRDCYQMWDTFSLCLYVWAHTRVCQWLFTHLCHEHVSLCVCDWQVVDLFGTAFSLKRCLCCTDDWHLICGPEISVLEKELSLKRATAQPELVPFGPISLTEHVCQVGNEDRPDFSSWRRPSSLMYLLWTSSDSCFLNMSVDMCEQYQSIFISAT